MNARQAAGACVMLLGAGLAAAPIQRALEPPVADLVQAATEYVETYERALTYLLADEVYRQQETTGPGSVVDGPSQAAPMTVGGSVASTGNLGARPWATTRVLRGELFLTYLPANRLWVAVHDVASVDGKPVGNRESLQALLRDRSVADVAQHVKDRNASFNLGGYRTISEPTFALKVVEGPNAARFEFTRGAASTDRRTALVDLHFKERVRPTLVLHPDDHHSIESFGVLTIEAETGRVRRTRMQFADPTAGGEMTTTYAEERALALWVPVHFTEQWKSGGGTVTGDARYTNWRRFQATGRIVR